MRALVIVRFWATALAMKPQAAMPTMIDVRKVLMRECLLDVVNAPVHYWPRPNLASAGRVGSAWFG
jgi:hypothetical protein